MSGHRRPAPRRKTGALLLGHASEGLALAAMSKWKRRPSRADCPRKHPAPATAAPAGIEGSRTARGAGLVATQCVLARAWCASHPTSANGVELSRRPPVSSTPSQRPQALLSVDGTSAVSQRKENWRWRQTCLENSGSVERRLGFESSSFLHTAFPGASPSIARGSRRRRRRGALLPS